MQQCCVCHKNIKNPIPVLDNGVQDFLHSKCIRPLIRERIQIKIKFPKTDTNNVITLKNIIYAHMNNINLNIITPHTIPNNYYCTQATIKWTLSLHLKEYNDFPQFVQKQGNGQYNYFNGCTKQDIDDIINTCMQIIIQKQQNMYQPNINQIIIN